VVLLDGHEAVLARLALVAAGVEALVGALAAEVIEVLGVALWARHALGKDGVGRDGGWCIMRG